VIHAVMGLTPIKTSTFWSVSQLGMLAGTAVYVYADSSLPDLQTLADKSRQRRLHPESTESNSGRFCIAGFVPVHCAWSNEALREKT